MTQPLKESQHGESQLEVQLVHADSGSRVVLVQARRDGKVVDAALGEGATAEDAEDRARQRLAARLSPPSQTQRQAKSEPEPEPEPEPQLPTSKPRPAEHPSPPTSPAPEEPPADPEDWSSELARLDLELQRLGWDRDQEAIYLERVFNHPNRNRLTSYGDLLAYLQALEGFAPGTDPATAQAPLRRRELLSQSDVLLGQLQWDPGRGRAFLEQHFALTSRQQLSDSQLLQFNMLLESEWLAGQST